LRLSGGHEVVRDEAVEIGKITVEESTQLALGLHCYRIRLRVQKVVQFSFRQQIVLIVIIIVVILARGVSKPTASAGKVVRAEGLVEQAFVVYRAVPRRQRTSPITATATRTAHAS
jgi:hypothetical protein